MARAGRLVTRSRRRAARLHLVRPEHSIWTHCETCVQLHRRMLALHMGPPFMRVRCRGLRGGGDGRVMQFVKQHD
jgi:hypothetical protein